MATVINVTADRVDGTYGIGEPILVQVQFSVYIDVTGSPRLLLETGATDRYATFDSVVADTVNFLYIVQYGDSSADLDYKATNSLDLNGGTIKDLLGSDVDTTLFAPGAAGSLGANKNIVIRTACYSRGDYDILPGDDADLENIYTSTEISNVAIDDEVYTDQTTTNQYAIHEFKHQTVAEAFAVTVNCDLKTTIAPSVSPVVLEVYDRNASAWVEVDRNDVEVADTDFVLSYELNSGSTPTFANSRDEKMAKENLIRLIKDLKAVIPDVLEILRDEPQILIKTTADRNPYQVAAKINYLCEDLDRLIWAAYREDANQ